MLVQVTAILWRKCYKATIDTLNDRSKGQFHIALPQRNYEEFFVGVPKKDETSRGGFTLDVPIEPFSGSEPVGAETLSVRFMGEESGRGDWNIPSQRSATAYPLWRPNRGAPTEFDSDAREYLVIVRDVQSKFHARWIQDAYFDALPPDIQDILNSDNAGWRNI